MPRFTFTNALFSACLALSTPALAYNPQWLQCTGEMTIAPAGGTPSKERVSDVYVYDSDGRNLFMYSDVHQRLSALGAKAVSDQDIRWSRWAGDMQWEGQLNRATGTLTLSYKSDKESREWRQSCKPTKPRPES